MKIVIHHPVVMPAVHYGGIERMVEWLARGLVETGHEVWVVAEKGSRLKGAVKVIEVEGTQKNPTALPEVLDSVGLRPDVVHFMAPPPGGDSWLKTQTFAALTTIHGNGDPGEIFPIETVFLSSDHAKRHGRSLYVYNGLDPADFIFKPETKEDWYLFLSKTSWKVKNVRGAIRHCANARVPVKVAGGDMPFDARMRVTMRGWLDGKSEWLGSVNNSEKANLMARAKAFLFPVVWDEPFGLVVAEALFSGTPVLASPRGSLKEMIHSDVGALIDRDEDWTHWLSKSKLPWNPQVCRDWAMKNFHYLQMTRGYCKHYSRLLNQQRSLK